MKVVYSTTQGDRNYCDIDLSRTGKYVPVGGTRCLSCHQCYNATDFRSTSRGIIMCRKDDATVKTKKEWRDTDKTI